MKVSPYTRPEIYLERSGVPLSAANDSELYLERDGDHEISPGGAIAAAIAIWLDEHWPALAIGGAIGLTAVGLPFLLVASLLS